MPAVLSRVLQLRCGSVAFKQRACQSAPWITKLCKSAPNNFRPCGEPIRLSVALCRFLRHAASGLRNSPQRVLEENRFVRRQLHRSASKRLPRTSAGCVHDHDSGPPRYKGFGFQKVKISKGGRASSRAANRSASWRITNAQSGIAPCTPRTKDRGDAIPPLNISPYRTTAPRTLSLCGISFSS
jgi:hypothetical protein